MRFGALVSTLVLITFVASAQPTTPGQRPSTMPTPPRSRPAPPPPVPPRAPRPPVVAPPIVTPPSAQTPQTSSPFDATARTYAPRYDGRSRRRIGPPYYSSAIGIGDLASGVEGAAVPEDVVPPSEFPEPRLTSPVFEGPRTVAVSHAPDTYYVIPGCYAGNRPPDPQRLPKDCDPRKLRTTPVR